MGYSWRPQDFIAGLARAAGVEEGWFGRNETKVGECVAMPATHATLNSLWKFLDLEEDEYGCERAGNERDRGDDEVDDRYESADERDAPTNSQSLGGLLDSVLLREVFDISLNKNFLTGEIDREALFSHHDGHALRFIWETIYLVYASWQAIARGKCEREGSEFRNTFESHVFIESQRPLLEAQGTEFGEAKTAYLKPDCITSRR